MTPYTPIQHPAATNAANRIAALLNIQYEPFRKEIARIITDEMLAAEMQLDAEQIAHLQALQENTPC